MCKIYDRLRNVYKFNNRWSNDTDDKEPVFTQEDRIPKPSLKNDLNDPGNTICFIIHMTQPGEIFYFYNNTRPSENQTISLPPGWSLIGYPSSTNKNRTAALNNLIFGTDGGSIWKFNAATQFLEGGD